MNNRRQIVARTFVATGKDGVEGFIDYVDRLERCIIYSHKFITHRERAISRAEIDRAMEEIAKEIKYEGPDK